MREAVQRRARRVRAAAPRAKAAHHAQRATASVRPRRTRPRRRPACSAPARQLVAARTACAGPAAQRGGRRPSSGSPGRTCRGRRARLRPGRPAPPAPRRCERGRARAPARLVTVASVCASAEPGRLAPLERRGRAAARGRSRRARLRRTAGASRRRRPACGRDQRVDRAVGERRRGSRRGRAAGAAAASGASRRRSSRCRRRSGAGGGCSTSQVTGRPSALARAHERDAGRAADRRHRCTRAPVSRTSSKIVASAIVSASTGTPDRPRRVATRPWRRRRLPSQASCGRSQTRVAEGRRVLQRAVQHQRCRGSGDVGLREADAAGLGELGHLGQRLARRAHASARRADRRAPGCRLRGAELEHLDEARLVERRVGVGRADEARHAARDRRAPSRTRASPSCSRPGSRSRADEVDEARRDDQRRARRCVRVGVEVGAAPLPTRRRSRPSPR